MYEIDNPFNLFKEWYNNASKLNNYNAMYLATANSKCIPSVRTVFLKSFDEKGFIFYTNINSNKGNDLKENPNAEVLFFWKELKRQIRISGTVKQADSKISDTYFASRSRERQINAWASYQSSSIPENQNLDDIYQKMKNKFANVKNIPRPQHWSGFVLKSTKFEFWREGVHRLHSRLRFTLINGNWQKSRLFP